MLAVFLFVWSFESSAVAQLQGSAGNVRVNIQWTGNVDLDLYVNRLPCEIYVLGFDETRVMLNVRASVVNGITMHTGHDTSTELAR